MGARGFDPAKGVRWTASTESSKMRKLVDDREAIFTKQRSYATERDRELRSIKAIETCAYSAHGKKQIMDQYYRYCDFCDTLKVPAHPISTSMIALYCFAKVSWKNLNITNTVDLLRTKRRLTIPVWYGTGALGFESDTATLALNEFRSERKNVRVRITSPKKKIQTVTGGAAPNPSGKTTSLVKSNHRDDPATNDSDLDFGDTDPDSSTSSEEEEESNGRLSNLVSDSASTSQGWRVEQLPTPGLPRPGQRFKSAEALVATLSVALLPVYGHGVALYPTSAQRRIDCARGHAAYASTKEGRCHWKAKFDEDESSGEVMINRKESLLYHNHGPNPRIVEDPTWRPTIRNVLVRQMLGMDDLESQERKRKASEDASASANSPLHSHSESTFKKPRLPPPLVNRPVASTSNIGRTVLHTSSIDGASQSRSPHKPHSASPSVRTSNQSIPLSQLSAPSRNTQSHPPNSQAPQSLAPDDGEPSILRQLSLSSTNSFLPQLSSFLRSLHPSLDALAIPLHSSGLDSLELLHLFNAFESTTLDSYFRLLKERDVDQTISNVHLRLLKKKLEEAKLGGYSD